MSGAEGKQNNRLSQKEIETEEMAQELMAMAMYEEGMGYEQMKEILDVINESKHMAGIKPDNRSSQEIIEYLPEITISKIPKSNSHRDIILDDDSIPKPSFSYRQASGRTTSPPSGRRSALDDARDESSSPELFTIEEPKRSSSEAEPTEDMEARDQEVPTRTRSKNEWPSLPGSSPSSHQTDNNERDKSKKNQRMERWRIDPLDAVVDEKDVPLRPRKQTASEERVPYSFCHMKRALEEPEIGEKVVAVIAYKMEEEADIWRRSREPEDTEFQWGLPIKVGNNIRNLDKKTVTEDADTLSRPSSSRVNHNSFTRRNMDRSCKRKAIEFVKDVVEDQIDSDDSGENIFDVIKKAKTTDKTWAPMTKSNVDNKERNMSRQEKMFSNMNSVKEQDSQMIGEYDSDDFDNDDLPTLFQKGRNKVKENSRPTSPNFVPRRIVPPIPGAPKPRAPRRQAKKNGPAKRRSPLRKTSQVMLEKNQNSDVAIAKGRGRNAAKTVTLNDDEIMSELEDDSPDEVEVEVKPKPLKGLASKLQIGASKLLETKNAEERMERFMKEEKQKMEQKDKIRKEAIQIQRLRKEEEERREREEKEAQIKAKEENYRKNEVIRDRDRRRRAMQQKKGVLLMDDEEIEEAILHSVDDDRRSNDELVNCPICKLEFSLQEIENHAAACEQYDRTDKPGPSRSEADNDDVTITNEDVIHDCFICSNFTTSNPIAYEEHVNACKNRQRNGVESPWREVVEVPTSPPKTFLPISEQTGSSINYAGQFPNGYFQNNVNAKRRNRN